jgi:hypothetical protein
MSHNKIITWIAVFLVATASIVYLTRNTGPCTPPSCCSCHCASPSFEETKPLIYTLFDEHNQPNKALLELLALTKVNHNGTLEDIVEQTKKAWMRPAGKERWEVEDIYKAQEKEIKRLAQQLGLIDEITPDLTKEVDVIIIPGSLYGGICLRLGYALALLEKGLVAHEIVMLGSARPIVTEPIVIEGIDVLLSDDCKLPYNAAWKFNGTAMKRH